MNIHFTLQSGIGHYYLLHNESLTCIHLGIIVGFDGECFCQLSLFNI